VEPPRSRPVDDSGLPLELREDVELRQYEDWDDWGRYVVLPRPLAAGWYVLTVDAAGARTQVIVQVTDLALNSVVTTSRSLAWVNDTVAGQPVRGATVIVAGDPIGQTDADGIAVGRTPASVPDPPPTAIIFDGDDVPSTEVVIARTATLAVFTPVGNDLCAKCGSGRPADRWLAFATERYEYRQTDTIHAWDGGLRHRPRSVGHHHLPRLVELARPRLGHGHGTLVPGGRGRAPGPQRRQARDPGRGDGWLRGRRAARRARADLHGRIAPGGAGGRARVTLDGPLAMPAGDGFTGLTLADGGRGRGVPTLEELAAGPANRGDRILAAIVAARALRDAFGGSPDALALDFDLAAFLNASDDGEGISLLPYGGGSLELDVMAALSGDPQLGDTSGWFAYREPTTREERLWVLAGLAASGESVLADIVEAATLANLSVNEEIALAIAALAAGDEPLAGRLDATSCATTGSGMGRGFGPGRPAAARRPPSSRPASRSWRPRSGTWWPPTWTPTWPRIHRGPRSSTSNGPWRPGAGRRAWPRRTRAPPSPWTAGTRSSGSGPPARCP
jgi:hypothetical protein